MYYYLIDYLRVGDHAAPPVPKGVGFLLLAAPAFDPAWGLFMVGSELPTSDHLRCLPIETEDAIVSAVRYPPAVALARDEMPNEFDGTTPTDLEFCHRYAASLRAHMSQQGQAPYMLLKASRDEVGYLAAGQFYWVLHYIPESETVAWVSSDYFVYHNSVADFEISPEQRQALLAPIPFAI